MGLCEILTIDPEHVCAAVVALLKAIQSWGIFLLGWKSCKKMDNHHLLWQTSEQQHDLNTNYYAKEQEYNENIYGAGANRYPSWNYYSSHPVHNQDHQEHHQQQHMDQVPMSTVIDQEQLVPPPQPQPQVARKR